jgi:two-component system CheB/CheR fusion protein
MQLLQKGNSSDMPPVIVANSLKQMRRLESLINDLLHVSKLNKGKLPYIMETIEFSQVIQETVSGIQVTTSKHQLIINHNPIAHIQVDKERLEQVLINYITNAVKYSPDADKVIINSEIQDDYLIVSVQDFGIGIEKKHLANLFDRFYRVDNTAMKYEGLGLGLYIASEVINRHGGNFWIESEKDKGSTFYFKLPLNQVPIIDKQPESAIEYTTDYIHIKVNKPLQILEVDWRGYLNLKTVQEGCMKMIEYLKENKYHKVLNSNINILGNWSDASDWVGKEWFPLIELAGLTHFAWVYSTVTFSQLAAEKSNELRTGNVVIKFFDSNELAKEWLKYV